MPRKRLGARDVGALAHVDEQGVLTDGDGLQAREFHGRDGDSRHRAHLCRNTDKTGERRCDGAKAGAPKPDGSQPPSWGGIRLPLQRSLGEALILRGSAPTPAQSTAMAEAGKPNTRSNPS